KISHIKHYHNKKKTFMLKKQTFRLILQSTCIISLYRVYEIKKLFCKVREIDMKILLADDEFFIREGLKSLEWETIGLKIVGVASNGVEALNIARKYLPDIILTDIKMPKMDGLEMSEKYLK